MTEEKKERKRERGKKRYIASVKGKERKHQGNIDVITSLFGELVS